jgi:uncharacterized membrane protein
MINFSHFHLLFNHLPILGTMFSIILYVYAFIKNSDELKRTSLGSFVVVALLTIPSYMSGIGAAADLNNPLNGIDPATIQLHESSAMLTLLFVLLTGALSVGALWSYRGRRTTCAIFPAVLLLALVTMGLAARTGNLGGAIKHPEAFPTDNTPSAIGVFIHHFEPNPTVFATMMTSTKWWWAFMMTLHFVGLIMIMGTIAMFDLRILGFARQLPIAALDKLVPWGLLGLGINIVTGMLSFIGMPLYYTYDMAFWLKMAALVLAGSNLLLFYATDAFRECAELGPGEDAPGIAKLIAASSIILWFIVIVLGRYIQFFEDSVTHGGA